MDIMTIIGQYAFPIVACIAMGLYVHEQTNKHRDQLDRIMADHKMEVKEITIAINNNTVALQRLLEHMGDK